MRTFNVLKLCRALLFVPFLIAGQPAALAQTADVEQRVSAAANAHMELYYRLFSERNMAALPEQVFSIPWMTFGASGINVRSSRDAALVDWQASLIGLLQRGWDRSEFTVENVCVLNDASAIVSGYNTRYGEDGAEMSVGSVVYVLARDAADWRIVAYTAVERGKQVTC